MRISLHDVFLFILILATCAKSLTGDSKSQASANTTEIIPSPLVVPPSQYWDGIDGQWSTFALRVGTPSQYVRALVSTNSPETMVVLPLGCTSAAIKPVPSNCANSRGGLFNPNSSKTWLDQGLFGINEDGVGFEANLGYSQNADYGLETLGLGYVTGAPSGPTLQNQTVAGIASTSPFYLGILGLSTQPVNYSIIGNFSAPSYFSTLRSEKLIPSLSWSYTAGAKYRLKAGQYAQLIFGGFDTSRFTQNSATFTLNQDINRDIVVALQSITYSGTTQATLLSIPSFAFIESTDPNIWLPAAACEAFEEAFGISVDHSTGLYLINTTHYTQLQAANPQVTFTLANSLSGGQTVNIVLPFSAFALPASYPFTKNDTYYFPLRKAANDSQITLGRAFLQEAYLTVDYERGNFSVSQCVWEDGATEQISTILSPIYAKTNSSTPLPQPNSDSKPMGIGVIVGVAIGGGAVLALIGGLIYFLVHRRNNRPAPTDMDIALTNVDPGENTDKETASLRPPNSPYLADKKFYSAAPSIHKSIHSQYHRPDSELGTMGEIFQMPGHGDEDADYVTAVNRIASGRRAATTYEIDGRSVVYELHGSEPVLAEMDDETSRSALSPLSARSPLAGGFPRLPSPVVSPRSPAISSL